MAYSDDHGRTWTPSNVWETFVSSTISVTVGADGAAYALGGHQGFVGVFASTDGATWEERSEGNEDFSFWYGHLVAVPGTEEYPDGGLLYIMKFPAAGVYVIRAKAGLPAGQAGEAQVSRRVTVAK